MGLNTIDDACAAEARGDYLSAFQLALASLQVTPHDTGALRLLARLCLRAGDDAAALHFALAAGGDIDDSIYHAFDRLCAALDDHVCAPGAALPFAGLDSVLTFAAERHRMETARLANAALRFEDYEEARALYDAAVQEEPHRAELQLAAAELAHMLGDTAAASQAFGRAWHARKRFANSPRPHDDRITVLALCAMRPWTENTPLEFIADPGRIRLERLYLDNDTAFERLMYSEDVLFNALGAFSDNVALLQRMAEAELHVINDPSRVMATGRVELPATLRDVDGVAAVQTTRVAREELSALPLPLLVRPPETHAGRGLRRIDSPPEWSAYLAQTGSASFDVCPFVEYAGDDGRYRKYRVVIVDGRPFPYHLAVSSQWMVHYVSSEMAAVAQFREEEQRFLEDPASVLLGFDQRFRAIGGAIGLDYVALDVALLPDGTLLVFEADPVMLIHAREADARFHYRLAPVARIREALTALVEKRRR